MNEKIEVPTMQVPPLKKICMTIGQLPASYVETMSYYEMLVWFVHYLRDDIIPVVNANGEATRELQELYVELQSYVNNYFDNLDVQEEINNKLDEMAESGELTDIIAQYLGLAGMITFNNVAEMKLAQNLVNGSKCCTLGYYEVNDGGNAIYKIRTITNDDIVDESRIIALYDDSLIAELIVNDIVNIKQFGARENTYEGDYSTKINNAFTYAIASNKTIYVPTGTYNYSGNAINFLIDLRMIGDSPYFSILNITSNIYLFETTSSIRNLQLENLGFNGGKGYIHSITTSYLTSGMKTINNCRFFNYSKVAISSTSRDNPYWRITNCTFRGSTTSIGIVLPEGANMSVIEKCAFELNGVHIKLPGKSQDVKILYNDFIEWERMAEIDIWFVATSIENTTGMGCIIEGNKFGDEGAGNNSVRVLFADDTNFNVNEETFVENIAYSTSETSGRIQNLSIINNEFRVRSDSTKLGVIVSYTNDVRGLEIYNRYQGLYESYIIYFPHFVETNNWAIHDSNIIRYRGTADNGVHSIYATNSTIFKIIDEYNQYYPTNRFELKNKGGSSTDTLEYFKTTELDGLGHTGTLTYDSGTHLATSGGGLIYFTQIPLTNGKTVYVEYNADNDIGDELTPLNFITWEARKGSSVQYRATVPLTKINNRYRVRITTQSDTNTIGFTTTANTSFHMSNLKMYYAEEPLAINDSKYAEKIIFGATLTTNGNELYFDSTDNTLKLKLSGGTIKTITMT